MLTWIYKSTQCSNWLQNIVLLMWNIGWTNNPVAGMKGRSCKTYFISLQLRFMEKLLIIFPAWQQHHNIKENLKCTNFHSPLLNLSKHKQNITMNKTQIDIKYSGRAAWRMNGDNLGTIRRCGHTVHKAHTWNTKNTTHWLETQMEYNNSTTTDRHIGSEVPRVFFWHFYKEKTFFCPFFGHF